MFPGATPTPQVSESGWTQYGQHRSSSHLRPRTPLTAVSTIVFAVASVLFTLIGIGAHHSEESDPHTHLAAHPLLSSLGGEFSVDGAHAHLSDGSHPYHPEQLAAAVLPRPVTDGVLASGAVFTALTVPVGVVPAVALAGRSPPPRAHSSISRHDRLLQLCLSRR